MVEWEATLQIECLDPVTGEAVDYVNVSLRVDQQMAVVVDCSPQKTCLEMCTRK